MNTLSDFWRIVALEATVRQRWPAIGDETRRHRTNLYSVEMPYINLDSKKTSPLQSMILAERIELFTYRFGSSTSFIDTHIGYGPKTNTLAVKYYEWKSGYHYFTGYAA